MLQGHHLSVLAARNRDEFQQEVVGFARHLGFDRIGTMTVVEQANGSSEFINIDNAPEAYRKSSEFQVQGQQDPVMQHCKKQSLPILWGPSVYADASMTEKWEHQSSFGYGHGIALAMHLPRGLHFMLGVNRDQALPADPQELQRLAAELQLYAVYAQDAALRIIAPRASGTGETLALTRRELECLRWTMDGKTAWELARILDIAEHTAVRHLYNASRKLGCTGKHQAVMRALRLGLIW